MKENVLPHLSSVVTATLIVDRGDVDTKKDDLMIY